MIRSAAQHALYPTTAEEKCPLAAREREALGAAGRGEHVTVRAMFKFGGGTGCAVAATAARSLSIESFPRPVQSSTRAFSAKWEDVSRSGRIVVAREAGNTYAIEYGSDAKVGRFEAQLGQLGEPVAPATVPCFKASEWREADQLFHRDPHWVGGDGASSVDLGHGRIPLALWRLVD